MKRFFCVCLIFFCIILSACTGNQTVDSESESSSAFNTSNAQDSFYKPLLCDIPDSLTEVGYQRESTVFHQERTVIPEEKQQLMIEIDRTILTGEYQYSIQKASGYQEHRYNSENYSFTVDSNQNLTSLLYYQKSSDISESKNMTDQELIVLAKQFLQSYRPDIDQDLYEVSVVYLDSFKAYDVKFIRKFGEIDLNESAEILIDKEGTIQCFSSYDLGQFPSELTVSYDLEAAKASIEQRLNNLYASIKDRYDEITYNYHFYLTLIAPDTVGLACSVEVNRTQQLGYDENGEVIYGYIPEHLRFIF